MLRGSSSCRRNTVRRPSLTLFDSLVEHNLTYEILIDES